AAPRPRPRRAGAEAARGPRPGGADGDPGLAGRRSDRARGGAGAAARTGPGALGPAADAARPGRPGASPKAWARRTRPPRERAEKLGRGAFGPFTVQAAIAACHARAGSAEETEWARIPALYEALAQLTPSPVGELNRAGATSRACGPGVALEPVEALAAEGSLDGYHLL